MERFEDNFSEDELYILYARDILKHTFQQIAITLKTAGFIVWTIYNRTKARQSDLYLKYLKRRTGYLVEDILSGFEPYSNKYYKKNILRVYFLEQQYHGMLDGYRGQKYALRIPLERQPENTMAPEVMDEFYFYLENVRPLLYGLYPKAITVVVSGTLQQLLGIVPGNDVSLYQLGKCLIMEKHSISCSICGAAIESSFKFKHGYICRECVERKRKQSRMNSYKAGVLHTQGVLIKLAP